MAAHSYTLQQIDWLRKNRPIMVQAELVTAFNEIFKTQLSGNALKRTCLRYGIQAGNSGRFVAGDKSWNAGLSTPRRSVETAFKKGHVPKTYLPVGTEIKRNDNYIWKKIADPNVWHEKHRLIWESVHGPLPKGTVVIFLDGDRLNFEPDNLQLITRQELLRLNLHKYTQAPPELKPTILALSKVEVAIFAAQSHVSGD